MEPIVAYKFLKTGYSLTPLSGLFNREWTTATHTALCSKYPQCQEYYDNIIGFGSAILAGKHLSEKTKCRCGNYSYKTSEPFADTFKETMMPFSFLLCDVFKADVLIYGAVQEYEKGYRSQFCRITKLTLLDYAEHYAANKQLMDAIIKNIAEFYAVPVSFEVMPDTPEDTVFLTDSKDTIYTLAAWDGLLLSPENVEVIKDEIRTTKNYKLIKSYFDKTTRGWKYRDMSPEETINFMNERTGINYAIAIRDDLALEIKTKSLLYI